jgi:copper resistance protein B
MRAASLAFAAASMTLATPAAAQDHSMHKMPGMTMPAAPKARPAAKPEAKPRAKPQANRIAKPRRPAPAKAKAKPPRPVSKPRPPAAPVDSHADHIMPGMTMSPAPAPADPHAGHAMPDRPAPTAPADPHAGHDTGASPPAMEHDTSRGTALPAGNAPAPAPPVANYADRIYPPQAMAKARASLRDEHGGATFSQISFNLAEVQIRDGRDGYRWDGEAWFGGDIDRLTIKTEGEGDFGRGVENAEIQALYSRAVGPYFNLQAGIRYDFQPNPSRTYATVGFEGLAPYWFDVEGALFLSDKGDVLARLEGYYDQRITQRLILQPRAELNFAAQDVPENGIGSGLSDIELGLRLRYEIEREFAPYIGVSYDRRLGDSARFSRMRGEGAGGVSLVAGVRTWF